jgi:DNA gyrase subunit A
MITCVSGVTIRTGTSKISEQGRATQGVKLIRLDDEDQIAAITNLNEEEVEVDTTPTENQEGGAEPNNPESENSGTDSTDQTS